MATDIRGLEPTLAFVMGRLTMRDPPVAGFTAGRRYWPLALGVDCLPAQPVLYVLTADDTGTLQPVPAPRFRFDVDNLVP